MRRIVLIRPKRDGRIFGKAPGSPYTLMRLASLVPDEIPVEIWDENLYDIPVDTLSEGDLVGITSMSVNIERAELVARRAMAQGAGVVVGGVHSTLMPEHVKTFAHSVMIGEGYFTWQQLMKDFEAEGIKDFQNIVSQGISDKLLQWKGIEATVELSKSPNSKIVVVGNPTTGLPLLFSGERQ